MTCLDDITDRMDEIITLISLKKDCCDDNITYGPGIELETEIDPGEGDPPDYYGETAVTDWADWEEHVCHNAHVWVDSLVWQAGEMDDLLQLGGVGIGAVGAGLLLLGALGFLIAVPFAVVAATAAGILAAGTLGVFLTTADDIEDARDDIVCALIWGHSVSDVIEAALGSASLDWLLFFSQVPYDNVTSIIYEGGYESEYLPADTRDDCNCGVPPGYSWQDAEEILFTLSPDTFGRINSAVVTLPQIVVGTKAATSASWGCQDYPCGCDVETSANDTYQTLAVRYTVVTKTSDGAIFYNFNCLGSTDGYRYIQFYTLDEAEGIDATWALTQCDDYGVTSGGHAKRAIGFDWGGGGLQVSDTTPGQTPISLTMKIEHLVWNG